MTSLRKPSTLASLLAAVAALAVALAGTAPSRSAADVQGRIASGQSTAQSLQAQIASDSRQIQNTAGGLRAARQHLASLQSAAAAREAQLSAVQRSLLAARDHLTELENQLATASRDLAANLRASYEGDAPDALSVLLDAHGFADLIERIDFLRTVGVQDARVVTTTTRARQAVARQAAALVPLEIRDRQLAAAVVAQRDQAAALQAALLHAQADELRRRAHDAAALSAVEGRLRSLRAQEAAALTPTAPTPGAAGPIQLESGGLVQPPPGAPAAVAQVMAAGNAIAGLPYVYGGGHGSFHASGYDCSGSVSYALAAAGLVSSPLDSTGFESWGDPGPGRWITVYANAGHAFMEVAGWRFDTVALASGGTRWSRTPGDTSGFVARHPPGL